MHIFMIAQYLNLHGRGENSFYRLGRNYAVKGHKVTLFASLNGLDIELGQRKIGLLKRDGLLLIAFNVPFDIQMNSRQKFSAYFKFIRMVERQGRLLPKPDMIIAETPPLSSALPALKLKKFFDIPVILEVNELWPDAPVHRGVLNNRMLIKGAENLEKRVYNKADRIVAGGKGIADAVRERCEEKEKVTVIPAGMNGKDLIASYEKIIEELR